MSEPHAVLPRKPPHDAGHLVPELLLENLQDLVLLRVVCRLQPGHRLAALRAPLEQHANTVRRDGATAVLRVVRLSTDTHRVPLALRHLRVAHGDEAGAENAERLRRPAVLVRRLDDAVDVRLRFPNQNLRRLVERAAHRTAALADDLGRKLLQRLENALETLHTNGLEGADVVSCHRSRPLPTATSTTTASRGIRSCGRSAHSLGAPSS